MDAMIPPPLRVILCHLAKPDDRHAEASAALARTVTAAFGEGMSAGYLSAGDDLEVEIRRFDSLPRETPEALLDGALHTLWIILVDRNLGENVEYLQWLVQAHEAIRGAGERHRVLLFVSSEDVTRDLQDNAPGLLDVQASPYDSLGEGAVRAAHLGIVALNEARSQLANAPGLEEIGSSFPSIFISHAKRDGLPLAMAIRDHLAAIPKREGATGFFYDKTNLILSRDWRQDLERGVSSSLLLVLRTDDYDCRTWCRREVLVSEQHATPAVVVDARVGLSYPRSDLTLGLLPTVRIPDGNLIRALHLILREGLRAALLGRTVAEYKARGLIPASSFVRVLHRVPSERSIHAVCADLSRDGSSSTPRIFYPDPPLGDGRHEALDRLLRSCLPDAWFGTPRTFLAETASTR